MGNFKFKRLHPHIVGFKINCFLQYGEVGNYEFRHSPYCRFMIQFPILKEFFCGELLQFGEFYSKGMLNLPPACIPLEVFNLPNNEFLQNLACTLWVPVWFTTASIKDQNCSRPSILVVVNHTGTQSAHAKFWRNSLLGRLNTSKGIQAGGKLSIPFE